MNYYEILGASRQAEPAVIDAAYRAMMRRYHPDVFNGGRDEADRRSKEINEAYGTLRDPRRREAYDATLAPEVPVGSFSGSQPKLSAVGKPHRTDRLTYALYALPPIAVIVLLLTLSSIAPPANVQRPSPPIVPAPAHEPQREATVFKTQAITDPEHCRGPKCRILTPFGWGGIEAGVTDSSAEASSGMRFKDNGHYTGAGDGTCLAYEVVGGPPNIQMLVEHGVVTTVEASFDPDLPIFGTDRGVRLGDSEKMVRSKYANLKQLPNIYSTPPDKMLFHYEPGGVRGIKFSIVNGVVQEIAVGTSSIEYVEGCL